MLLLTTAWEDDDAFFYLLAHPVNNSFVYTNYFYSNSPELIYLFHSWALHCCHDEPDSVAQHCCWSTPPEGNGGGLSEGAATASHWRCVSSSFALTGDTILFNFLFKFDPASVLNSCSRLEGIACHSLLRQRCWHIVLLVPLISSSTGSTE